MESLSKRLGYRIKKLRQFHTDLTQYAFAEQCGFTQAYMSRLERGVANPSLHALETVASALNVPIEQLFKDL
jgi:transcriptional regulator with XRE-family HTH domain